MSLAPSTERLHDEELLVIRESARLMGKSLDPGLAIREMLHLISEFLGLNRGRVVLRRPDGQYAIRYAYGLTQKEIERGTYRAGHGITGRVLQAGDATIVQDIDDDPDYLAQAVDRAQLPDETVSYIALPLVGNIPASGITAKGLSKRIEDALKRDAYLTDPRVAVEVQTFRPFYVLGEVRQPGEFPYMTGMTVLSAIAKAGGYDYRARQGEVVLVRTFEGDQKEYRAIERTPILPGDIVKVLERRF